MKAPTQSAFDPAAQVQRSTRAIQGGDGKNPQEDKIRLRAYLLAEKAGFPAGRADEFWHQAEKDVRSGNSR
jgi:hypothetical protein